MGAYLDRPNTEKETESGCNAYFRHGSSAMQGWRKKMEDAHIAEPDLDVHGNQIISLYAVFDGHGGPEVAQFAKAKMPNIIKNNTSFKQGDYKKTLCEAYMPSTNYLSNRRTPTSHRHDPKRNLL